MALKCTRKLVQFYSQLVQIFTNISSITLYFMLYININKGKLVLGGGLVVAHTKFTLLTKNSTSMRMRNYVIITLTPKNITTCKILRYT